MRQAPGEPAETSANIERFEEALDLLACGGTDARLVAEQDPELAALVDSATRIHRLGEVSADSSANSGPDPSSAGLEATRRQSIWEDLMATRNPAARPAGHDATSDRPADPVSATNARRMGIETPSTSAPQRSPRLLQPHPHPQPQPHRPSSRWFQSRFEIQPVVSALLVGILLVSLAVAFRGFGGGSGALVTPTASAHGNPELAAIGSPEASPATAFACDVSGTPVAKDTTSESNSYGYEKRGPISEAQAETIPGLMGPFSGCLYALNYRGLESVATSRFVTDLQWAVAGTHEDLGAFQRRKYALTAEWSGPLPLNSQPLHTARKTPDGTLENLNLFLDTVQRLDDGRIGMLASVAPEDVSPVPNDMWVARRDSMAFSVWFIGFQETDEGLRVDEIFGMCGGSECVPLFGADAATPEASREASPETSWEASPAASPVVSDSRRLPDATPSPAASGASGASGI